MWNGLSDHIYDIYSTERGAITNDVEWQDAVDINNPGEIIWLQRIQDTVTWAVVSNIRGQITSDAATWGLFRNTMNDPGEIVWSASDGHDLEIFSSIRGQITDNEIDDYYPTINNRGTIAWRTVENDADFSTRRYTLLAIYAQQ
jgi:hypothetical protein